MYPDYPAHASADIEMFDVFIVVHINITGTYVTKYMILYYHNYTGYRCMNILFTRVWEAYYNYIFRHPRTRVCVVPAPGDEPYKSGRKHVRKRNNRIRNVGRYNIMPAIAI